MGSIRRRESVEIRQRALETAARKYREGCGSCADSYLDLAREHGASAAEIARVTGPATPPAGGVHADLGRRRLLQVAASTVVAGAAGALLFPGRAAAQRHVLPLSASERTAA